MHDHAGPLYISSFCLLSNGSCVHDSNGDTTYAPMTFAQTNVTCSTTYALARTNAPATFALTTFAPARNVPGQMLQRQLLLRCDNCYGDNCCSDICSDDIRCKGVMVQVQHLFCNNYYCSFYILIKRSEGTIAPGQVLLQQQFIPGFDNCSDDIYCSYFCSDGSSFQRFKD